MRGGAIRPRREGGRWAVRFAAAAALVAAAVALLPGAARAEAKGGAPAPGGLSAFRVDVSKYPMIGLVLTVPGGEPSHGHAGLTAGQFAVSVGGKVLIPQVKQLSPDDVELAVAADGGLPAAGLSAERGAAEAFLAGLPADERTVDIVPDHPGILPGPMSQDPAPAMLAVAGPAQAARGNAAARLSTALSAFTAGPQVRRTIVLVVTAAQPLSHGQATLFARRLVASGTALYVLDAAPGRAPAYDTLAAGSGGFAVRVTGASGWAPAFTRIGASLNEQYYLRFADPGPLPGQVLVHVRTASGVLGGNVDLPAHNPVAPRLPSAPRPAAVLARPSAAWDTALVLLSTVLIVIGISYGLGMVIASRRDPRRGGDRGRGKAALPVAASVAADDLFFVFLVPCLNEEAVIANSLHRLLSLPADNFVVLVIDDGSDDRTVEVINGLTDPRILVLSRRAPNARQGKGEALNAAIRHLTGSPLLEGRDPDRVIAVVVDADGRLDADALRQVTPVFDDPTVGAVQIGVRINNRFRSTLARMQDMEFVIYTEVFQRGRRHIGSVGLGGNGQFMRLSALLTLGGSPWGRSLAEDLDMGIRLIAAGWRNEYCSAVAVHQQGVEELPRLIRQRSRWFQGHLQSWQKIPLVLRRVHGPARTDLLYHMTSPAVLLIASLLSASFVVSVANAVFEAVRGENPAGWWVATTYALTFGPGLIFSAVYWSKERAEGLSVARAVLFAHLYVCYGMMWYAAGWWGISRTLRGRTSWAKTDRVVEAPVDATAAQAMAPAPALAAARVLAAAPAPVPAPPPAFAAEESTASAPVAAAAGPRPAAAGGGGSSGPPAAPGGSRAPGRGHRGRRRRIRVAAVAAAVVLAGAGAAVASQELRASGPPPGWDTAFNGYGSTSVTGSGAALAVSVAPERATTTSTSHAALVVSSRTYGDVALTLRLRTEQQLRTGPAGHPQPWEVGWVLWHYTSDQRFYALTLEPTGWELSKQDPSYPGGERFLASGLVPRFPAGASHAVGVVQVGNQITVSADGRLLARYTDHSDPYLGGAVGFYAEDAQATFDHIAIASLVTGGK